MCLFVRKCCLGPNTVRRARSNMFGKMFSASSLAPWNAIVVCGGNPTKNSEPVVAQFQPGHTKVGGRKVGTVNRRTDLIEHRLLTRLGGMIVVATGILIVIKYFG